MLITLLTLSWMDDNKGIISCDQTQVTDFKQIDERDGQIVINL